MDALIETLTITLFGTLAVLAVGAFAVHVIRHRLKVRRASLVRSIRNHPAGRDR